jgi:quercetin dioxygenase-like cupin family protein
MNINQLHSTEKGVSAVPFYNIADVSVTSLRILKGETLQEHISQTPALLFCVSGEVFFENELGTKETLVLGDYLKIDAMVKHWVNGVKNSQLLLIK